MTETLYEHAGGDEGLHRLEELFYAKALADPVLKQLFTHRVLTHVDHLTWFTAESFGGPPRFTDELGFGYIIDVHRHLQITDEQRERFVEVYLEALDDAGLPDDEPSVSTSSSEHTSPNRTRAHGRTPSSIRFVRSHTGTGQTEQTGRPRGTIAPQQPACYALLRSRSTAPRTPARSLWARS